jgi:2-isopropylmalate synthase
LEQIAGSNFTLEEFKIQSLTEGKEAIGNTIVRLGVGDKIYSGNGISTDIIGASLRAYLNAVNKYEYESNN